MRRHARPRLVGALLGCLLLAACGAEPIEEVSGPVLFRHHCASCHGAEGRGDGPLAESLRKPPADLTAIAQRAGGRFDPDAVKAFVDGRWTVSAHGPREMPVWGVVFGVRHVGEPFYVQRSGRELDALVEHLRSLQVE